MMHRGAVDDFRPLLGTVVRATTQFRAKLEI